MRKDRAYVIGSLLLFFSLLLLYLWCSAPTVMYFDSGELQTVALKGGIAHPSGYPTYILLGQLFGRILPGDRAHRITAMSSFFGALSVSTLLLILLKLGMPFTVALAGAVVYALSFTFWWCAIRAEVYTPSVFFFLTALWLTLRAFERTTPSRTALAGLAMGIALTGHLAFAPAIVLACVLLAVKRPMPAASRPRHIAVLLLFCVIGGLTPYLYLVWIDSGDHPTNYLDYSIELSGGQFGFTEETFDDPWERIPWLITGRQYRGVVYSLHPASLFRQSLRITIIEFLYHFGPIAFPFFILGVIQAIRDLDRKWLLLLGIFIISALFTAGMVAVQMLHIFLLPATIATAVFVSRGLRSFIDRLFGGRSRTGMGKITVIVILCGALTVLPHTLRLCLNSSRSFPARFKLEVEAPPKIETLVPSLRDHRDAREYGEAVMRLVPENSLVIGKWNEFTVLYYLHYVEEMRPDIELEGYFDAHFIRLLRWQEKYDVATHPFVFLGRIKGLTDDLEGLDSVRVDGSRYIYVYRKPLENRRPHVSSESDTGSIAPPPSRVVLCR